MAIPAIASVTGAAVPVLTTPGYTMGVDTAPDNQKQWVVTALTGTQTGVVAHSLSSPFLLNFGRPKAFKGLQKVDPITGVLRNVPKNKFTVRTVKGVLPLAGQAYENLIIRTEIEVPAGADLADTNSVYAALSLHAGAISTTAVVSGLGSTLVNGVL